MSGGQQDREDLLLNELREIYAAEEPDCLDVPTLIRNARAQGKLRERRRRMTSLAAAGVIAFLVTTTAVRTLVIPNASVGWPIVSAVLCVTTGVAAFQVLRTAKAPRRRRIGGGALAWAWTGILISGIVGLAAATTTPPTLSLRPDAPLGPDAYPPPPRGPDAYPATVTHGNPDAAGDVPVNITIARPAAPGRTYWLFAYLPDVDPTNPHPLYYELDRLGSRNGAYRYEAALGNTPPGSERMYLVYEVDAAQDKKLKGLLGKRGAAWDMRRLEPPCNCQASEKHLVKTPEQ